MYACMYVFTNTFRQICFRDSLHCGVAPRLFFNLLPPSSELLVLALLFIFDFRSTSSSSEPLLLALLPLPCFPSPASLPLLLSPSLPPTFRSRHLNRCHCSWMPHLSLSLSRPPPISLSLNKLLAPARALSLPPLALSLAHAPSLSLSLSVYYCSTLCVCVCLLLQYLLQSCSLWVRAVYIQMRRRGFVEKCSLYVQ